MPTLSTLPRRVIGTAILAATVGLAAASPASASTGPPPNDWLIKVVSPDGGATSYLFNVSRDTYYVVACDTAPDGHHAEGWIETGAASSGPFVDYFEHVRDFDGNETCTVGPDTRVNPGRFIELVAGNYEQSNLLDLNTSTKHVQAP